MYFIFEGEIKIATILFEQGEGGKRRIYFRMVGVDIYVSAKFWIMP